MQGSLHAGLWWPLVSLYLPDEGRPQCEASALDDCLHRLPHDALTALEFPSQAAPPGLPDVSQRIESPAQVDHLIAADPDSSGSRMLRRWKEARWGAGEGILKTVNKVWLEFDLRRAERPTPLLCLRLPHDKRANLLPWLDALPGGPHRHSRPHQAETIRRCLALAPANASPMYLFDLSAREVGAIRLEWYGVEPSRMTHFLERLGVPSPTWLQELAPRISDGDRFHLSFDVRADGSFGRRVGVEVSYAGLASREPRWQGLFQRLIDADLWHPQTSETVWRWLGQDHRLSAGGRWPRRPELRGGHLARVFSHVKIAGEPDEHPLAKMYLLFRYLAG